MEAGTSRVYCTAAARFVPSSASLPSFACSLLGFSVECSEPEVELAVVDEAEAEREAPLAFFPFTASVADALLDGFLPWPRLAGAPPDTLLDVLVSLGFAGATAASFRLGCGLPKARAERETPSKAPPSTTEAEGEASPGDEEGDWGAALCLHGNSPLAPVAVAVAVAVEESFAGVIRLVLPAPTAAEERGVVFSDWLADVRLFTESVAALEAAAAVVAEALGSEQDVFVSLRWGLSLLTALAWPREVDREVSFMGRLSFSATPATGLAPLSLPRWIFSSRCRCCSACAPEQATGAAMAAVSSPASRVIFHAFPLPLERQRSLGR